MGDNRVAFVVGSGKSLALWPREPRHRRLAAYEAKSPVPHFTNHVEILLLYSPESLVPLLENLFQPSLIFADLTSFLRLATY